MTATQIAAGKIIVAELRPSSPVSKGIRYVMRWNAECERKFMDKETVGDVSLRAATDQEAEWWYHATDSNDRNIIILPRFL